VIDDGPFYKHMLYRTVKRFDLDIAAWPWPPDRASEYWGDYWRCRFELVLFQVGLGIRKLIEAGKISIEEQSDPVKVEWASRRGDRAPDSMNVHRVEDFYSVQSFETYAIPMLTLSHEIVHSYVLQPRFVGDGTTGLRLQDFYLAGDYRRRSGVYLVEWRTIGELMDRLLSDGITQVHTIRTGYGEEIRLPFRSPDSVPADWKEALNLYAGLSRGNANAVARFEKEWNEKRLFINRLPPRPEV
jgi:hypothetical protein